MNILDIFKRPATTAADLSKKIAEVNAQLPALQLVATATETERAQALLTLGDKEVEKVELRLAAARRDVDRATSALEALQAAYIEAERREAAERLTTIRVEAEAVAEQAAREFLRAYQSAGSQLFRALEAATKTDEKVRAANEQLRAGGISETIASVRERVALRNSVGSAFDPLAETSLLPIGSPGWGGARVAVELIGGLAVAQQ